jgi:molybdate transport system ATP-binding protein
MLEVKIRKKLPGFTLDVGFSVDNGILSIMGPSGSGKTMTLQCIAGLVRPHEGYIRLNDRVLFDSSDGINLPARARKVGFVFQNYALYPHLTVQENVAYGIQGLLRLQRDQKVSDLLVSMGIRELGNRYPRQLSSGEQQRVALARALVTHPDVLLLDEPFSALDIINKEGLELALLDVERSFGGNILFVTHDFSQGYSLGSRIAIYEFGHIIQCDSRNKVISSPANLTVARLMGLRNLITGYISRMTDGSVYVMISELGCDIRVTTNGNTALKKGQLVMVGILPEKVRIVTLAEENAFTGCIDHIVEGMGTVNLFFRLAAQGANGHYMMATSSRSVAPPVREGERCYLYFPPENLVIVADPGTSPASEEE